MAYIIFSRVYPAYHPRKGEPTHFVEKILQSLTDLNLIAPWEFNTEMEAMVNKSFEPKHHTMRAGNRWKEGDWFSPRVWSGAPYKSKQIIIAPDIQIVKTWEVRINMAYEILAIGGCEYVHHMDKVLENLSKNDGLSVDDFLYWFGKKDFTGQIISWNKNIRY